MHLHTDYTLHNRRGEDPAQSGVSCHSSGEVELHSLVKLCVCVWLSLLSWCDLLPKRGYYVWLIVLKKQYAFCIPLMQKAFFWLSIVILCVFIINLIWTGLQCLSWAKDKVESAPEHIQRTFLLLSYYSSWIAPSNLKTGETSRTADSGRLEHGSEELGEMSSSERAHLCMFQSWPISSSLSTPVAYR